MNNMHLRFISPLRLRWIYFILILLLKLLAPTVFSGSIVKYLPGYEGQLPFKLETGYESVGDSELFYYFIESQGDIEEDLLGSGGPSSQNSQNSHFTAPKNQKRDRPYCTHCRILGHTVDRCYKIHGYPPSYKFRSNNNYNAAAHQVSTTDNKSNHSNSFGGFVQNLNFDQYQQLMSMLSTHLSSSAKVTNAPDPAQTNCLAVFPFHAVTSSDQVPDLFPDLVLPHSSLQAHFIPDLDSSPVHDPLVPSGDTSTLAANIPVNDTPTTASSSAGVSTNNKESSLFFILSLLLSSSSSSSQSLIGSSNSLAVRGPGCSSFYGLIYEIGPLEFDIQNYRGGLPRLKYYPYAWTKTASIIFLDAPVGTGFSYARKPEDWPTSDSKSAEQSYQFLKKWLLKHPQYLQVELYIGGDSYSGMVVPQITKKIIDENGPDVHLRMNLKGYIMGIPHTDSIVDENSKIIFAHRMALISDELFQELKTSCKGNYHNADVPNTRCVAALQTYKNCIKDIYRSDILEPKCTYASPHMNQAEMPHRSLQENPTNFILSPPRIPELWCRGFVPDWQRCNKSISYTKDILSVVDIHRYLSRYGLQVLIECGDHDMVVPLLGTEQWIKSLNLTIVNDWRPWFVDGQVAGWAISNILYTQKYSEHGYRLTYATVKASKIQSYIIYR
ncbi:hypothetical protein Pint_33644 [Pistacia integerrima]|uniref:Uncharacterized protein n=1 Tax=Pistacia integerrima TaxID=434235 RepID=A0ACC0X8I4_9ROSI|nr:hypothetical protein Pint_33644 [Pistacia integerrima]